MPASLLSERSLTYGNRVDPWHKLGIPMNADGMLALDALNKASLNYKIYKVRGLYEMPDGTIRQADVNYTLWREAIPEHKKFDWEEIGTCTDKYVLMQNEEIAQILDDSGITKEWKVITMGALGKGDRFFVTLDAGRYSISGEDVECYVSVLDDKAGGASLKIVQSDVIVVCANTYAAADTAAKISANIPHNSKIRSNFEWKATLFKQVQAAQVSFKEIAEHFAHQKVTTPELTSLIEWAYPLPTAPKAVTIAKDVDKADELTRMVATEMLGVTGEMVRRVGGDPIAKFERDRVRVLANREAVVNEYALTCQERPNIAGSKWAAFNAFTGAIDHAPRAGRAQDESVRAERVTLGPDAQLKVDVFNALRGDLNELTARKGFANRIIRNED